MIYRNYDDTSLAAALPAALELSRARLVARAVPVRGRAATRRRPTSPPAGRARDRAGRPTGRATPPRRRDPAPLLGPALDPDCADEAFARHPRRRRVAAAADLARFTGRRRVVVATADAITARMAGPAIRAWRVAAELALDHEVRLVSLTVAELTDPAFSVEAVRHGRDRRPRRVVRRVRVPGLGHGRAQEPSTAPTRSSWPTSTTRMHLEQLEQARDDGEQEPPPGRARRHRGAQRAAAAGRLLPVRQRQAARPVARSPGVARSGQPGHLRRRPEPRARSSTWCPSASPTTRRSAPVPAIKGVDPGHRRRRRRHPVGRRRLQLVRPAHADPGGRPAARASAPTCGSCSSACATPTPTSPRCAWPSRPGALADELGLTGRHVFFNEEWVPYDERQNYLLDADVAVTTHFHHVETEFSFRTRVLDYLWAGAADGHHRRRRAGRPHRAPGPGPHRPARGRRRAGRRAVHAARRPARAEACRERIRRDRARARVGRGPAPARRVLPGAPAGPRPHGGPGRRRPAARTRPSSPRRPRASAPTSRLVVRYLREGGPVLLVRKVRDRALRLLRG